jgi:DNA-binding transcriptional LysR family regulator
VFPWTEFRGLQRGVRLAVVSRSFFHCRLILPTSAGIERGWPASAADGEIASSLLSGVADSSTDLAITGRPLDIPGLEWPRHFMDNPLVVISASAHPLAALYPVRACGARWSKTLVVREAGKPDTRAAIQTPLNPAGA